MRANYYCNQIALDLLANTSTWSLPNAIYLDAVMPGGRIHTGEATLVVGAAAVAPLKGERGADPANAAYAFVDTVLYALVRQLCAAAAGGGGAPPPECATLPPFLAARRAVAPLSLWNDPARGRRTDWPPREL